MASDSEGEECLDFHPHPEEEDETLGPICPTCKGHGTVDETTAAGAIALIPVSDKRLKPRRTKLYIAIAVLLTLAICGVLAFLLFERPVSVQVVDAEVIDYNVTTKASVSLTIVVVLEAKNQNYFSVSMSTLHIKIQAPEHVGNYEANDSFTVGGRTSKQLQFETTINFEGDHATQIIRQCARKSSWNHFLLILSTTINWSYISLDHGQLQKNDWDCFTCRRGTFPDHGKIHQCLQHPNNTAPFLPINPPITSQPDMPLIFQEDTCEPMT